MLPIEKFEKSKLIFIGGKGGVGKTVLTSCVAMALADRDYKTLLACFNPVHSLSSIFQQDLSGGAIKEVKGVKNLSAMEIEIGKTVEGYKQRMNKTLRQFLKYTEIPLDPKPFINIATMNPAFQEAASFDRMMDVILDEGVEYDRTVFDTAAVANAIRLIGLSKIYGLWLQRVISTRKEALSLRVQLSFRKDRMRKEVEKDPVLNDFLALNVKYEKVKKTLTDPRLTNFIFVTIPTVLSISVVERFIKMVKAYEIPSGGVVVNMVIPRLEAQKDGSGFLQSRFEEQEKNLKTVRDLFGNDILGYINQYSSDVVGIDALRKVISDFAKPSQ